MSILFFEILTRLRSAILRSQYQRYNACWSQTGGQSSGRSSKGSSWSPRNDGYLWVYLVH